MSEFDPEKERERLRKQYEREQQKREATEKMSELLLQGATMTNAHCSACNDPIFRYDGQEFCPTCERAIDRDDDAEEGAENGEATAEDADQIHVTNPDETRVRFGTDETDATPDGETHPTPTPENDADGAAVRESSTGEKPESPPPTAETPTANADHAAAPGDAGTSDALPARPAADDPAAIEGDLAAARESLVRTLTRYARAAESAEDPPRAREYLDVAREAARTLEALRR